MCMVINMDAFLNFFHALIAQMNLKTISWNSLINEAMDDDDAQIN